MPNEAEFYQYINRAIALFTEGNIAHINLREHSYNDPQQKETIENLHQLQNRLLEIVKQHQIFGEGNDKFYIAKKSYNDQMWLSLNHLKELHQHLITSMTAISQGDLRLTNIAQTYKGELGSVLTDMIHYLKYLVQQAHQISTGNYLIDIKPKDHNDELGTALEKIAINLRSLIHENEKDTWLINGQLQLIKLLDKNMNLEKLCSQIITFLAKYIDAQVGVFYVINNDGKMSLISSFAYNRRKKITNNIAPGEGLIGQALIEKKIIIVSQVPPNYMNIESGLGEDVPNYLAIIPLIIDDIIYGVIELGTFETFGDSALDLLTACSENIAMAIRNNQIETNQGVLNSSNILIENTKKSHNGKLRSAEEEIQKNTLVIEQLHRELAAAQKKTQTTLRELEDKILSIQQKENELSAQNNKFQKDNAELAETAKYLESQQQEIDIRYCNIEKILKEIELARQEISTEKEHIENTKKEIKNIEISVKQEKAEILSARNELNNHKIEFSTKSKEFQSTKKQLQSSQIIENGGLDLLNDIQDLAKIESGNVSLNIEELSLSYIENDILNKFKPLTQDKNFDFIVEFEQTVSNRIETDCQRLLQVIKHILLNAFKFTEQGTVSLTISKPSAQIRFKRDDLDSANTIAFSISDTGIGINKDQQLNIMAALQLSTSTDKGNDESIGLGLTHAREITKLLGGELQLESTESVGSTFTLLLPIKYHGTRAKTNLSKVKTFLDSSSLSTDTILSKNDTNGTDGERSVKLDHNKAQINTHTFNSEQVSSEEIPLLHTKIYPNDAKSIKDDNIHEPVNLTDYAIPQFMPDDREHLSSNNKTILIVENDEDFATVLIEQAQKKHYQCIVAGDGKSCLHLVAQYQPDAITMDLELPDMDGLTVLDLLKHDLTTCHIPVFILSTRDESHQAHQKGAIGYTQKPINESGLEQVFNKFNNILLTEIKHILLIEDSSEYQNKLIEALNNDKLRINAMSLTHARNTDIAVDQYDCMIIDPDSPDLDGLVLLETLFQDKKIHEIPLIINTWVKLSDSEKDKFTDFTQHIISKDENSVEDLLNTVNLLLHQQANPIPSNTTSPNQENNEHIPIDNTNIFYGRTVLLVDDDLRNTFALSNILEDKGLNVIIAENGQKALNELSAHDEVDLIMMDILMPVMDGFEAMQKIREQSKYCNLPIIALTNEAMTDDKTKCLQVGANNYIDKPVNIDQLLSILKSSLVSV